ncbi:MAG: GGDEF domain-containing protein [Lachnospiraceae bacterium]|nr:GGDEF domain-containing protein [Lachnospiraceae bacterium]
MASAVQTKTSESFVELKEKLEEAESKLRILMDNIPGGVLVYDADTGKILEVSDGCLSTFDCTEEQFRDHYYNNFDLFVMKEDRAKVKEQVAVQTQFFGVVELLYRVLDLNGNVVWISHKARLVDERDGRRVFYAVLSDVTNEQLVQKELAKRNRQLKEESERYALLEEATDNVTYDYDVVSDTLVSSLRDSRGNRRTTRDCVRGGYLPDVISKEDYPAFEKTMKQALKKPLKGVVEYRIYGEGGKDIWYRLNFASFEDESNQVYRIVGSAKDITLEKAERAALKAKVQLDPMTGLLNKTAMRSKVEEYLEQSDIGMCHALLMIDTDNFKSVNDRLGHQYGDKVIQFVASTIRDTFRDSDFVGRVGGDEFMVFMKHTTPSITEERAEKLNSQIRQTFTKEDISVSISCSIGISYFGADGEDYDSLYKTADEALYDAKNSGKNCYRTYGRKAGDA